MYKHTIEMQGWKLDYPKHFKKEFYDPRVSQGRQHHTYSTYLPGQPVAIMPFHLFGTAFAAHEHWPVGSATLWFDRFVGPLFGALTVVLFFLFAVRLGFGLVGSLVLALILGFASTLWPDEQSVLEHGEVGFFLLLGLYFAFRLREQGRSEWYALWTGMAVGGAIATRYQDGALGALAVGLYLILPSEKFPGLLRRIRWEVWFGFGMLPFVALDLFLGWLKFGSPLATGHHETVFGYPPWKGALGLLVSPGKGLLWYCPVILLLLFAGPRFAKRYPALAVAIAAMAACFIGLYANVQYWHGDPAWGPRYIFPIVPFLVLPVGELFRGSWRLKPLLMSITAAVVCVSFVIQLSAVSVSPWRSWYRVISYEEQQGYKWEWIAARYRYFWNIHESPLDFQVRGLAQLAIDNFNHTSKYELVAPDEDPILDRLTQDYPINQWSFWFASNEFNWWMGNDKVMAMMLVLISLMLASGTYVTAEAVGVFASQPFARPRLQPVSEAA